jgi:hypothetical protein
MVPAYANRFSRFISGLYSSDRSGPLRELHLLLDVARDDSVWSKLEQTLNAILTASSILDPTQVSVLSINAIRHISWGLT